MTIMAASAPRSSDLSDQPFYLRIAYLVLAITIIGFAQLRLRGLAPPLPLPVWVHIHAAAMIAWLALFIVQNHLAAAGNFAFHRRLGWAGALLTVAAVAAGVMTVITGLQLHRAPPFFGPGYFLSLTMMQMVLFPALVFAAIFLRGSPQYHRRLMFGALIVVCGSPGLGRALPLNFMTGEQSEWVVLLFELALLGAMARHDQRTIGQIHPATVAITGCIMLAQLGPSIAVRMPAVNALARQIAG